MSAPGEAPRWADPVGAGTAPHGRRFRISLTVTILTAFTVIFLTVMGFTGFATYRQSMRMAVASAVQAIADLTARTAARTAALVDPLYATIAIAPRLPDVSIGAGQTMSPTEASFRGLRPPHAGGRRSRHRRRARLARHVPRRAADQPAQ